MATKVIEEVVRFRKNIAKLLEQEDKKGVLEILEQLKSTPVTKEVLTKTDIGVCVGKLRANPDERIATRSKDLVRKWKTENNISNERKKSVATPKKENKTDGEEKRKRAKSPPQITIPERKNSSTSQPTTPGSATTPVRTADSDGVEFPDTGDATRNKAMKMYYKAMAADSNSDAETLVRRTIDVETAVSKLCEEKSEYASKFRSLYLNLVSKDNKWLRDGVVSGEITANRLVTMSPEEMVSEERRQQDQKLREENLFNAQGAGNIQAETDQFRCGKCKQRKCTYYQMQTRSADEPMTTFVTCVNCSNRWKFC